MNKIIKSTLLGFYQPAFFFLKVHTDEDLNNLDNLIIENKSTLVHEYIHFLQDITNTYGLLNISHTVNTIKAFNNIILDTIGDNFEIPVDIEEMLPEIEKNRLAMEAYFGNICDLELDSASIIMNIESVDGFVAGFEKKIPYMKVDFLRSGKRGFCYFGALEIMESMAYMIEKCFFDNVSAPSYPYHFVEYISTFIYPDITQDKKYLIILCDIALNSYHPAKFLVEILEKMKEEKYVPKEYYELYEFVERYNFKGIDGVGYDNYMQLFQATSSEAINDLNSYFTIDYFTPVAKWCSDILNTAKDIRVHYPFFWCEILKQKSKKESLEIFIRLFIQKLGYPMMSNNLDFYYFSSEKYSDDNSKILSLRAISELQLYLANPTQFEKQGGCGMQKLCSKTIDISKMHCKNPWDKFGDENIELCSFGMILKMWGLYKKYPKQKDI